jgi:hypothetical protein
VTRWPPSPNSTAPLTRDGNSRVPAGHAVDVPARRATDGVVPRRRRRSGCAVARQGTSLPARFGRARGSCVATADGGRPSGRAPAISGQW